MRDCWNSPVFKPALDYTFELPWSLGSLETSAHYLDTQRLKSQIATAAPHDISGQIGYSKNKGSIDLLYANQGFSWDWQGIFIGPAQFQQPEHADFAEYPGRGRMVAHQFHASA